jgi:hypothetical protein
MIKNLYRYIILAFIAIYFYCYKYHSCSFVEGYRNTKVYIGRVPMESKSNFMENDTNFGSNSIFETGLIIR